MDTILPKSAIFNVDDDIREFLNYCHIMFVARTKTPAGETAADRNVRLGLFIYSLLAPQVRIRAAITEAHAMSAEDLEALLLQYFDSNTDAKSYRKKIRNTKQKPGESLNDFYFRLVTLAKKAGGSKEEKQHLIIDAFESGISREVVRTNVAIQRAGWTEQDTDPLKILRLAEKLESTIPFSRSEELDEHGIMPMHLFKQSADDHHDGKTMKALAKQMNRLATKVDALESRPSRPDPDHEAQVHQVAAAFPNPSGSRKPRTNQAQQSNRNFLDRNQTDRYQQQPRPFEFRCYNCNGLGHYARQCKQQPPTHRERRPDTRTRSRCPQCHDETCPGSSHHCPYCYMRLSHVPAIAAQHTLDCQGMVKQATQRYQPNVRGPAPAVHQVLNETRTEEVPSTYQKLIMEQFQDLKRSLNQQTKN